MTHSWTFIGGGIIALTMAAAATLAFGQESCGGTPSATKLHVVVEGVRSADGVLTGTVYGDDPHRFLRAAGELTVWREPATTPTTDMCVWLPGPGTYAVAIYHDAKRANHFVRGPLGMPTQDYGFSGNPHLLLGPPSLGSTKFPVTEGETTVRIKLKYP